MSLEPEADRPALAHVTDHVARGLARLTQRWRGKPVIEAILSSHLAEVQEIEDALWEVIELALDTATGDGLDQIAALLGEPRQDLDDEPLRTVLRARILANRSRGSFDELHAILALFAGDAYTLGEYPPAAVLAALDVFPGTVPAARMGGILRRAVSGGVGAQLVAPASVSTAFRFSSSDEVATGSASGFAPLDQSSGGHLAGVY